jgi:hypothetical protein
MIYSYVKHQGRTPLNNQYTNKKRRTGRQNRSSLGVSASRRERVNREVEYD